MNRKDNKRSQSLGAVEQLDKRENKLKVLEVPDDEPHC